MKNILIQLFEKRSPAKEGYKSKGKELFEEYYNYNEETDNKDLTPNKTKMTKAKKGSL